MLTTSILVLLEGMNWKSKNQNGQFIRKWILKLLQTQEEEANLKLPWEYNAGSAAEKGYLSVSQPTSIS